MTDLDTKIAAIRAGLDGVTPGPWTWPEPKHQEVGRLVGLDGAFIMSFGWTHDFYPLAGILPEKADASHIARLDPETVRSILDRLDAVTRERDEARARIAPLEEALRPFDELAASFVEGTEDYADDHSVTVVVGRSTDYLSVKLGDIRRARAALDGGRDG